MEVSITDLRPSFLQLQSIRVFDHILFSPWSADVDFLGHVFPGATLPFGMAKAVADVDTEIQGGYASDGGDSKSSPGLWDSGFITS